MNVSNCKQPCDHKLHFYSYLYNILQIGNRLLSFISKHNINASIWLYIPICRNRCWTAAISSFQVFERNLISNANKYRISYSTYTSLHAIVRIKNMLSQDNRIHWHYKTFVWQNVEVYNLHITIFYNSISPINYHNRVCNIVRRLTANCFDKLPKFDNLTQTKLICLLNNFMLPLTNSKLFYGYKFCYNYSQVSVNVKQLPICY